MKLKGQTSQYTTTGKNLFDGILENGNISAGANIADSNIYRSKNYIPITSSTAYAFSVNGTLNRVVVSMYDDNKTFLTNDGDTVLATTTGKFTTYNNAKYVRFRCYGDDKSLFSTGKIQLETGTSVTSYEKYSGGKASPNPDFPQEVNNVSGDNVIRISNKNLIEDETFVQGAFNDSTGTKRISCRNIKLKANTTYTFSSNLNYSTYNVAIVTSKKTFPISSGEQIYDSGWKTATFSFTTGTDDVYANIAVKKAGELAIVPSDVSAYHFQLEKGNTATTYIAHQGNNFELNFTKNLFDSEKYLENASISNNTIVSSNNNNIFYIPVQYGRNYTMSFVDNGVSGNILYGFSNDKPVIGGACTYNLLDITQLNKHTFTPVSANNKYLCIRLNVVNTNQYLAMENIQVEIGTQATEYIAYNKNPIELCKIGTYQDYIYKKDGKWYKHKEIGKITFNGTESWSIANTGTSNFYYQVAGLTTPKSQDIMPISDYFIGVAITNSNTDVGAWIISSGTIRIRTITEDTVANFKTWLSTNTPSLYYVLATPIEEEITYTPLIRQLDEAYNSGLYDVTNISQDNSSEAFILDLEACKNNINGIVEYIRR